MRGYKIFYRSFLISSVIIFSMILGFFGISKAYENIRLIGFGEYRKAVEIDNGKLLFFDFEIDFNNLTL